MVGSNKPLMSFQENEANNRLQNAARCRIPRAVTIRPRSHAEKKKHVEILFT